MSFKFNRALVASMCLSAIVCGDERAAAETAVASSVEDANAQSTDKQPRAIALFDGKSLDGWTTGSGAPVRRGWEVQDGELVRTSSGGAIYSDKEYEDFVLDFEWKIAPGVNGGVKYRIKFYEVGVFKRPGLLGCEYQLYDDARNPSPDTSTGALYALYAPNDKKQVNPPGEYNKSRIVVAGTKIEHWLNGEKILEVDASSDDWRERVARSKFAPAKGFGENRRGRIELQDHGGKVWFRSITLRPSTPGE